MKYYEYINQYLEGLDKKMSEGEYKQFMDEKKAFIDQNKELPEVEFQEKVKEKYSDWVMSIRMNHMLSTLNSINLKLKIFLIIMIISIIIGIVGGIKGIDIIEIFK